MPVLQHNVASEVIENGPVAPYPEKVMQPFLLFA
jgi:hypothetical protein